MDPSDNIEKKYIAEDGMVDLWDVWYKELHNGQSGLTVKIKRIIASDESEFQRIDVLDTEDFGKMLVLYGSLMVCDNDNNAYNEMIAHVPLFVHPKPDKVLIIGGGDCGALTETTCHPEVKSIVMCEIDKKVVEVAKEHFPALTEGLNDKRAKLIFQDGKKYIDETDSRHDIIILDLSDPVGPAADLFQKQFHQKVYERLTDDGILVAQTESPFYNKETVQAIYKNLNSIFPIVRMYTCFMPIYPSGYWSFAFCSKKYDPVKDFDKKRFDKLNLKTRYYNDDTHKAAFALPQFVKELFE